MSKFLPNSIRVILERVLFYLKSDEPIDMSYLDLELENLRVCIDQAGVTDLDVNEIGILLHGILIIEAKLKKLGLVSHLLKSIKDTIYDKSV
jgi:hypothetical protein